MIHPGIDSKGYLYAALATICGPKNMRIHRLVLMSFSYFEGCESVIKTHCDGIKTHCYVWNLEWSNYSENQKHAYSMGLTPRYRYERSLSDKKVIEIANLLMENKYSCMDIAKMYNVSLDLIYSIKYKRAYFNITDEYNFPETSQLYDENFIESICKIISETNIADYNNFHHSMDMYIFYTYIINTLNMPNNKQSRNLI